MITNVSKELYKKVSMLKIHQNYENERIQKRITKVDKQDKEYLDQKMIITQYINKSRPYKKDKDIMQVSVKYKYARNNKAGRQFAENGRSLQSICKAIRHTITNDIYYDIDMVNAHITILEQYCEKHNYKHDELKKAVQQNEEQLKEIMEKYKCDRLQAKKMRLKIVNGGGSPTPIEWLNKFSNEVKNIHMQILNDPTNRELKESINKKLTEEKVKWKNLGGKVCNHILCNIENEILMACIEFLNNIHIDTSHIVLVFDGFMIPIDKYLKKVDENGKPCKKSKFVGMNEDKLIRMSNYVNEKLNYKVQFAFKEQNQIIDLTGLEYYENKEPNYVIIKDDNEAAEKLMEQMKGRLYLCQGTLYIKTTKTKIWTPDPQIIESELINKITTLNLYKSNGKNNISYSGSASSIKSMLFFIKSKCLVDDKFVETLRVKSKNKLFFEDCVYDFKTGEFREETEEDMTPIRIHRKAPKDVDKEIMNYVIDVINSIFEKEINEKHILSPTSKNFIQHIGRAIAGNIEDKDWLIGLGLRDSGKGIITTICRYAFEKYCSEVDANNFINKPRIGNNDEAITKKWLMPLIWSRLIFANEVDVSNNNEKAILNGILIKSLHSGGDYQKLRQLYKEEIEFIFGGRCIFFLNEMPDIKPSDACQTMSLFEFPNKFIQPNIYINKQEEGSLQSFMKRAIPNLKEKVCENKFSDAFVRLVIDNYPKEKVINCKIIEDATNEYRIENGDEVLYFYETFDFSDVKSYMSSKNILEIVREKFPSISAQKVKTFLTKNVGIEYTKHLPITAENKDRVGYKGIKIKNNNENNVVII